MTSTRLFYKINYWLGISLFILPISLFFIAPDHSNFLYDEVRNEYINSHYLFYKLGGKNNIYDRSFFSAIAFFIFYLILFIFYFLFFLFSYTSIGKDFDYKNELLKTKAFVISCILLYCTVILIGVFPNDRYSDSSLEFCCWVSSLLIYFLALTKYQKYILSHFDEYILIFKFLCLFPIGLLIFFRDMTLIDYQLLFYINNTRIDDSPFLYISLIFSPVSFMAMPLFFSFNHYMCVKKLIMENTKDELSEDFYNFKFT